MNYDRLYSLREDNDLTQEDMGKICGVSRVAISQWERGKEIIPLNKLNIYSNYFDVSIDYILKLSNIKRYTILNAKLNKKTIGNRLKNFRIENNLTQKELAKFLNTTHSTISAYESGKTLILTIFAYEIAKKYNISMDWLCGKTK